VRAKEKYEISYRLNTEIGYWEAASNALFNISGSYFSLKDYDQSLKYANELQQFHRAHPETTSPASLFGDIFEQKGQLDSARHYLTIALEDQENKGDIFNWSICVINLARVVLAQGHPEEANTILTSAEKVIKENEMMDAEFAFWNLKANIYAELGQHQQAYDYQQTALELNDSIDHLNQMNMINDMNTKYETDRMEFQIQEQQGIIESKEVWLVTIMVVAIILVIGLFCVVYILRKNRKLTALLKVQNLQINHQRQKIISSINYAKKIQQSTLPKEHDFKKLFKDSFIYFKPKDIISGDFYAYQQIGEKIYVAAVDCTGHGVPGAFMSLIANSKLNKVVNELGERDPGRILTKMHREIQLSLNQESGEDHTMDGVEMSLCAIDLQKQTIDFAGAGSSIFIARGGEIHEFKGNFHGLGGADYVWKKDNAPQLFTTQTITYDKEDLLYMFSDGIPDQIGGNDLKKLNKGQFKQHLLGISNNALDHAAQGCDKFINDWRKNNQQTDDMMLIGIRL
jgi:serine phosphatase RsbU (regulator of sigma subunit)/Tfp pilus assembly protein PilF